MSKDLSSYLRVHGNAVMYELVLSCDYRDSDFRSGVGAA